MRKVRIATTSYLVEDTPHTVEQNLDRVYNYIELAADNSADILCLPEAAFTINVGPSEKHFAEEFPGELVERLQRKARSSELNLIMPYLVKVEGKMYSQVTIIDRIGLVTGYYRKVQLTGEEAGYLTPGDELPVFDLDIGKIAVMLCLEIHFPEIPRIYGMKGVDILFWPTMTHGPTQEALLAQLRSRAVDNSMVVVESNLACHPPYAPYTGRYQPGNARIMDRSGDIIAQTGRREGLAVAEIDLDEPRLTSGCVLINEPDNFRDDIQSITRIDLYSKEYAELAQSAENLPDQKDGVEDPD